MLNALVFASTKSLFAASCLLAIPTFAFPAGNVLVVDDNGPGPYTAIQAAVDAAQDGDVILVQSGTYSSFVVVDKSLTVVADIGAEVAIQGGVSVRDLASTRTVVLASLDVQGLYNAPAELSNGLTLTNNAGHVRVEACTIRGSFGPAGVGARVITSADVVFVACELQGGQRLETCFVSGGVGLSASNGSVTTIYGSTLRGNAGSNGSCSCGGGYGGTACNVSQSTLFASSSTFLGGDGGHCGTGSLFAAPVGGDGGDGISAGLATVRLLDSVTSGGLAGRAILPSTCGAHGFDGEAGVARYNFNSTYADLPGEARTLSTPSTVSSGTTVFIAARGQPGDVVGVLFGDRTQTATFKPEWRGMLLVPIRVPPQVQRFLLLGTVPANGVISYPLTMPTLSPGEPSRTVFLQALFQDPLGERTLSGARTMTVVP